MKYFVTGATGFIGGRVARHLLEDGHEVHALVRSPEQAVELGKAGVILHRGDVTDKASMRHAMAGAQGAFHIAGWYKLGARDSSEAEKINVQGTRNVLELAKELSVPRIVFTSTLAVFSDTHGKSVDETYRFFGQFLSEYDRTKWKAHYEVAEPMQKAGLPLVIVQPGVVYGPGDTSSVRRLFVDYLRGKLPAISRGTAFSWAHVDDIAQGHIEAMSHGKPGESYILCGSSHTVREALAIAEKITGVPAPRLVLPDAFFRAAAHVAKWVEKIVALPPDYSSETLRSLGGVTYLGDNTKARRELGFQTRPFEDGLEETLKHEMALLGIQEKK